MKIKLVKQHPQTAEQDFKSLVIHTLKSTENRFMLFAVDDIIIKDNINLSDCISYLKQTEAFGFYLRLGKKHNRMLH